MAAAVAALGAEVLAAEGAAAGAFELGAIGGEVTGLEDAAAELETALASAEETAAGISTEGVEIEAADSEVGALGDESFSPDSEKRAASKGVSVQAISEGVQGVLALANSVLNLQSTIRQGQEASDDIKRRRHAAGLVTKKEVRDKLVKDGVIPSYYSTTNIRRLLRDDTMPFGWSLEVAVGQGFANEVAMQKTRQRGRELARLDNDRRKRLLAQTSAETRVALNNEKKRSQELIRQIGGSVVF